MITIGSLFTGYGGLDMACEAFYGARTIWTSDIDDGACKIIAHRMPHAPNLGDIKTINWATTRRPDILTGGYPCQPFSAAGLRLGVHDERHLWPYVRDAIRHLRPRLTILENVAGHRSMGFDRVLGDLAEDGLHARWVSVRASDVGAPHQRERVFIAVSHGDSEFVREQPVQLAERIGSALTGVPRPGSTADADAGCVRGEAGRVTAPRQTPGGEALTLSGIGRGMGTAAHGEKVR